MRQNLLSSGQISVLYLDNELKSCFKSGEPLFDQLMALQGECFRALEGRKTQRVILNGKSYFIKQHRGIGWKEIIKNLIQLRLPIVSAKNEWRALQALKKAGVPTAHVAGYGERGWNPATRASFILMEELKPVISLEDLCRDWKTKPPEFNYKQKILANVADIARRMHACGINHRDFYICHFLLDLSKPPVKCFLIDLHRAQMRAKVPQRWLIKDLAGLYFSSKEAGLTQRDLLRFMKHYRQQPLRDILRDEHDLWMKVKKRGDDLYRDHAA